MQTAIIANEQSQNRHSQMSNKYETKKIVIRILCKNSVSLAKIMVGRVTVNTHIFFGLSGEAAIHCQSGNK
jgi:hypothetical protein